MALTLKQALAMFWEQIQVRFVKRESGKGLSTNDFTTEEKNKLASLENTTVDTTLTISNAAADAKAVGDALAEKQPAGDYALKTEILPADWNENDPNSSAYVQNRTHWVERPYEPIVWDGSTEGRDSMDLSFMFEVEAGSFIFYKISDMVLTPDQIETSFAYATCDDRTYKTQLSAAYEIVPDAAWFSTYAIQDENVTDFANGQLVSVAIEGDFSDSLGLIIPSSGTYAMMQDPHYVEISADVYHKVDWRYIPDEIASKNDVGIAISHLATREYVDNVAKNNITTNYVEQEIGKAIEGLPTKEYVDAGDEIPTYDMSQCEYVYDVQKDMYWTPIAEGLYDMASEHDIIKFTNIHRQDSTYEYSVIACKSELPSGVLDFIGHTIDGTYNFTIEPVAMWYSCVRFASRKQLDDSIAAITPESIGAQPAGDYALNSSIPTKVSDLTNDADYATETYVDTKVAGLVDSAPETLDTLNELAAALGDDPNFATTVVTEIGKKVDKEDGKGLSTNDYTTEEKAKLAGIAEGAEANVQADFDETDETSKAFIKNKPTKEDALQLAFEMELIDLITDENGAIYTDLNGEILSL